MCFPKCFPDNFVKEILPVTEEQSEEIEVYRVIKSGIIDRNAFLSSYEEEIRGFIPKKVNTDYNDCITYSTSCCQKISDARKTLKMFMKYHPSPKIAIGVTSIPCGPSQITKIRIPEDCKDSHVDWWVYEQATPEKYFNEVENNEEKCVL